jgi:hypothetical protein
LTRSTEARYHAPVPTVVSRPVLWEVADIVEQIYRIACTENLHPRPEEYDAAAVDYQAAHGLSYSAMCKEMGGAFSEIHERAQVIALMRLYRGRWRVWDPEGRRRSGPSRQPRRKPEKQPRKARRFRNRAGSCPAVAPESDFSAEVTAQSGT